MSKGYNRYTENTYAGKDLLRRHHLQTVGSWQIYGEDPNCDLAGHHSQSFLGTYHGTLYEAIKKAVKLPGFWAWGGGGSLKMEPKEPAEDVHAFLTTGIREKALAKLTEEEKQVLGLT